MGQQHIRPQNCSDHQPRHLEVITQVGSRTLPTSTQICPCSSRRPLKLAPVEKNFPPRTRRAHVQARRLSKKNADELAQLEALDNCSTIMSPSRRPSVTIPLTPLLRADGPTENQWKDHPRQRPLLHVQHQKARPSVAGHHPVEFPPTDAKRGSWVRASRRLQVVPARATTPLKALRVGE